MAFQEVIDAKQLMLLPILSQIYLEKWGLRKKDAMLLEFLP